MDPLGDKCSLIFVITALTYKSWRLIYRLHGNEIKRILIFRYALFFLWCWTLNDNHLLSFLRDDAWSIIFHLQIKRLDVTPFINRLAFNVLVIILGTICVKRVQFFFHDFWYSFNVYSSRWPVWRRCISRYIIDIDWHKRLRSSSDSLSETGFPLINWGGRTILVVDNFDGLIGVLFNLPIVGQHRQSGCRLKHRSCSLICHAIILRCKSQCFPAVLVES